MEDIVKIFALGGLDERGKNTYVVEVNDDIFVVDCGLKYPEGSMPGIDAIIADDKYLKENKHRVKAYLISHSHSDVNGGVPYFLMDVEAKVYASKRTNYFIKEYSKQANIKVRDDLFVDVEGNQSVVISGHEVTFFTMTHSAFGNYGIAIKTSKGYVIYSSDFIFDFSASKDNMCDLTVLSKFANEGVLALLCESEGALQEGFTAPNHRITPHVENYFASEGRLIISQYSQSAFSLQEIFALSRKYNRKICIYNRNVRQTIKALIELKCLNPLDDIMVDYDYIDSHEDVVVLVSGVGKRVFRELIKMSEGNIKKNFMMRSSDRVLILSSPIPGLEVMAANAFDSVYSTGAYVKSITRKQVTSMHAHKEDIKMLINILKPKYFIPVKGEYRMLLANANLTREVEGMGFENVFVLDNGNVIRFVDGKVDYRYSEVVPTSDSYIDGASTLEYASNVIETRQKMADNGVVILGASVSKKEKKIIAGVDVQMRGFVFVRKADDIVKELSSIFVDEINEYLNTEKQDLEECKKRFKEKASFKLKKQTGKEPLIIPLIVEL